MNVIGEQQLNAINDAVAQMKDQGLKEIVNIRSFGELAPGDRFKAVIADISPNQVTLKLSSGELLTARSLVLPDARIGDESVFFVKENVKGQILLEMVKPDEKVIQTNIVREALAVAGLRQTPENISMAREILAARLPLDAASLQKAAFFRYADAEMTVDKVLFLLKENFPAAENSVTVLNNLMSGERGLAAGLEDLARSVFRLPDEPLKKQLLDLLAGPSRNPAHGERAAGERAAGEQDEKEALGRIFINLKSKDMFTECKAYFRELLETLEKLDVKLNETTEKQPESAAICRELSHRAEAVKDNVLFMNHIQQYKTYMQIPFVLDGRLGQGELFVWKDGKGGLKGTDSASALVALDTAHIGRVETYITKSGKTLSFQMKAEKGAALSLINRNSGALLNALREKGYAVSGFTLKELSEPFTITGDAGAAGGGDPARKRYSFDMRV